MTKVDAKGMKEKWNQPKLPSRGFSEINVMQWTVSLMSLIILSATQFNAWPKVSAQYCLLNQSISQSIKVQQFEK